MMAYSGPLPMPQHLEQYEAICSGAANRIIAMTEAQLKHRQQLEKEVVKINGRNSTIGVCFGGVVAVLSILCGTYIILKGNEISGYVTMFGSLSTLVGVFVYGKRANKKELIEKQKLMESIRPHMQEQDLGD